MPLSFAPCRMIKKAARTHNLALEGLGLHEIPAEIFDSVDGLKIFDFSKNKLEVLPPLFGKRYAKTMKRLDLAMNRIARVPSFLSTFKQLHTLDLSGNALTTAGL